MNSTFNMSQGAGQKLEFAFQRNGGTTADLDWLSTGENLKSVMMLARGEAGLVFWTKPALAPEPVIDPIIRVDRTIKPMYPDWVKEVLHPDMEAQGPAEYSAESIDQWFLEAQKTGIVTGNQIYAKLQEHDNLLLKTCLGLRDLEEIQKKGIAFFRKYFKGKAVFGWSSVVRRYGGGLRVPCLCGRDGKVVQGWDSLDRGWDDFDPGLRHASDFAKSPNG